VSGESEGDPDLAPDGATESTSEAAQKQPGKRCSQSGGLPFTIQSSCRGLKPSEGRCPVCGRVISDKAPHCGRRTCEAVYPIWKRDQRTVVREALAEYGGLLLLTDITVPGTPLQEERGPAPSRGGSQVNFLDGRG
jgi:hypothetical protein